jgi:hypothetical protein
MFGRERRNDGMRSASETLLWLWLVAISVASVIGAVVIFFLTR